MVSSNALVNPHQRAPLSPRLPSPAINRHGMTPKPVNVFIDYIKAANSASKICVEGHAPPPADADSTRNFRKTASSPNTRGPRELRLTFAQTVRSAHLLLPTVRDLRTASAHLRSSSLHGNMPEAHPPSACALPSSSILHLLPSPAQLPVTTTRLKHRLRGK
jgi:hypothetical protein